MSPDLNNWHMLPKLIPKQLKPATGIQEHERKGTLSHILKLLKPRKTIFRRKSVFNESDAVSIAQKWKEVATPELGTIFSARGKAIFHVAAFLDTSKGYVQASEWATTKVTFTRVIETTGATFKGFKQSIILFGMKQFLIYFF